MSYNLDHIVAGLTPAQRNFMLNGKEDVLADRRVTRALCRKGLMGLAGYLFGSELYCFNSIGNYVRDRVRILDNPHA